MSYYESQRKVLGAGNRFALKIENRSDSCNVTSRSATHWLNATADQVARILAILSENDTEYVLRREDVGVPYLMAFGRRWPVADFMGSIFMHDVGKIVTKKRAGFTDYLVVENNEQRDARIAREQGNAK